MKRRIFAMLLALTMVVSMALSVSAEETGSDEAALLLDVTQGKGSVVIDVYLQGCADVTNGRFTVDYDSEVLTLAEAAASDACAMSSVNDETAGTVAFAWVGSDLTDEKTLMVTLTLEAAAGITEAMTYTAAADGIYADTAAVEVAGDSVTVEYIPSVDTAELEKAIVAAQSLKKADYTADSYAAVEAALTNAMIVLADADATQGDVDVAAQALNKAIAALVHDGASGGQNQPQGGQSGGKNPDSGDSARIGLWMGLMLLSLLAIACPMYAMIRAGKGKQVVRALSVLLVVSMVLTMVPGNVYAVTAEMIVDGQDTQSGKPGDRDGLKDLVADRLSALEDADLGEGTGASIKEIENGGLDLKLEQNLSKDPVNVYDDDEMVRIIVELEGKGLLEQGYTQSQIEAYGNRVSADAEKLEKLQDHVAERIEDIVEKSGLLSGSEDVAVKYNYTVALNGVAMTVPYGVLEQIRELDGVENAYVVTQYLVPEDTQSVSKPSMYATSGTFGSAQTWTELGYTGTGMIIAIIDTGLDLDHPSFADTPEGISLTLDGVEEVLTELNAYTLYSQTSAVELTAKQLYRSGKVPFGFNYVDCVLDVTHDYDDQGDHGTHVAGIAAANPLDTTSVVGVAPDAQVVVMKVFGEHGGAYSDDIIAAIEDCILLGVDVVNMSLGAQAGFSEDSRLINEVYGRILETDMLLAVAAGNANSAASGNNLGTNVNLTKDPDNGLVNSPATYLAATTVASLENGAMMMPYFSVGDNKIAYVDVTYFGFAALEGTYEYVVIPGVGDVADYQGLDVKDKVALVQRGTIDFVSKQQIAYNNGAVALVVYDNVDGDLISMYDGGYLPNVFITKADGEIMIDAAENGIGTMVIQPYGVETAIPSSVAGLLSDFSCWGVTPDLQLTPDVTAPGGNIYSCYTDGAYGTMSGTSMASPHIAGMSALVLQYLHDKYPNLTGEQYHIIAESLVMCTAVPVFDPDGILYSPRKQGAGSANVYSAITSPVYLTSYQAATGEWTPKASMGDDADRTGVFTFSFDMNNLSGEEQIYVLDGMLLTDQYFEYEGEKYMGETGRNLTGTVTFQVLNASGLTEYDANQDGYTDMVDVQYMLDVANELQTLAAELADMMDLCDDGLLNTVDAQLLYEMLLEGFEATTQVTVPANSSATVNVTVRLSAADMAYMDENYENGIYVDGFVRAYAQNEGAVDLSLPLVGFYGDWTDARMFDNGWYYDAEANDEDDTNDDYYNRYLNVVFATLGGEGSYAGLGINPYILEEYDPEHNVLSPNGDGYYDYVPDIYVSLMRSAELLDFTWTDEEGNELFYEWYAYARKSYYWSGYGMCMPAIYTDAECEPFTFYDEKGNLVVEDLQHLTLTIRGYLDDGDLDDLETTPDGDPIPDVAEADDVVQIPVVIDMHAPTIDVESIVYSTEDGRNYVTFDVEDNYDIAAVVATTLGGGSYEYIPVTTKTPGVDGEKDTIKLDITDYDAAFQLVLCDYGCNETYYVLSNEGSTGLPGDKFFAFRRYSTVEAGGTIYATDQLNGWYSFESADSMTMHTAQSSTGEAIVYAAEYVDGYIFGAQAGENGYNTLFVMKAGSWDRMDLGSAYEMRKTVYEWPGREETYFPLHMLALDMTYDYTTDTMYILANALENSAFPEGEVNILLSMDLQTGEITILGKIFADNGANFTALTLACDNDGVLYAVNHEDGKLYTINKEPVETTAKYGYGTYHATCVSTGDTQYWPAAYTQSMMVDHQTNTLYWAGYQGKTGIAYFIELDKQNGQIIGMTQMADNGEMVGLFKPYDSGKDIVPTAQLEGMTMTAGDVYLNVGQTTTLTLTPQPYNAQLGTITWESLNTDVAVVTQNGLVEAKGVGTAAIVATSEYGFDAICFVNVSEVSGTLLAYSGDYWLLMDAGKPFEANQIIDAIEFGEDETLVAAVYLHGYVYAATIVEDYDADWNVVYTTKLYKLDGNTLNGVLVGSYDGKTTALAFNYADGFMYGLVKNETWEEYYDETWGEWTYGQIISYDLIRVNPATAETEVLTNLDAIFPYSDAKQQWNTCSGALAIDYDGNFYVNGDDWEVHYDNILVRFRLGDSNALTDIVTFAGFSDYGYNGDAMVWSERNGGILHTAGEMLEWVDVSDMENVTAVALGNVRGASGDVYALVIPLSNEPDSPAVTPEAIFVDAVYTVPAGETVKVVPTVEPWNATGSFTFEIADTSIATVDENGVITGIREDGETTLTVTEVNSGLTATATVIVEKNPGYLFGFAQADIAQGIELEYWIKIPIANSADSRVLDDMFDFTVYAAAYYDGYIYAYGQSSTDYLYYFIQIDAASFNYKVLAKGDLMIRDMAFDYTTGTMYAVGYGDSVAGGLYQMDLQTAELTLVSDAGMALLTLACDDEGRLYAADSTGEVYAYDPASGYWESTGISGPQSQYLQAMTYDYNNDTIFWTVGGMLYELAVEYDANSYEYNGELITRGAADMDSGEMASSGCIVSGLFSVPASAPMMPETVTPAGVVMAEKNTVAVGQTVKLDAVVLPVSVTTVDQTLTWSSDDESIATVDENGVVTGVAAGTAFIYAVDAAGNVACTEVIVTAERRYFYGYDELSRSWVSFDTDGTIVNTWADAEGLSPIVAAQYINDVLYAYDADGYFYTIDTATFQRTLLGDGIHGLTTSLEAWDKTHNGQVYYVDNVPYQVVDMTYGTVRKGWRDVTVAYAVLMAYNVSTWRDSFSYMIVEIDLADGTILSEIVVDELVDGEMSLRPTNLYYSNNCLYTVNGYITGMVTMVDMDNGNSVTGGNIFANHWGDFNGGRSIIEDPITGEIYAIRDMRTDYIGMEDYTGAYAASELCVVSLTIANCESLCTIGTNMRIVGLFIK